MTAKLQTYLKYRSSNTSWIEDIPDNWLSRRGKFFFRSRKRINADSNCDNILSLTMKGVVHREELGEGGLLPASYETFQIFYPNDLAFKLIDLENYKTSRVGLVLEKGIMSSAYVRLIIIDESLINAKFAYYFYYNLYLQGIYNFLGMGVRSTLTPWNLLEISILIPPLETQKRIADFLDEKTKITDELIEKKEKLIEFLREKRAALITRAVTKGLDPKAKMKPSGVDWLGDIPVGWEIKKLKHVATVNRKSLSEDSTNPNFEFDYVDIGNVNSEGKILELQNYSFANAPSRARRLAENGDVIISTVRTYLRAMTRISNAENLVFSTGFAIFHPTKILDSWLYWSMQSEVFLAHVMANSTGVNYPGINEQKLSSISLLVSDEKEQRQIADFLDAETAKIDKATALIGAQIEKLKEYRSSLIYHAVTGKIKV